MAETPPDDADKLLSDDEREANRRFQETLGRLVNTPHKPHKSHVSRTPKRGG